MVKNLAILISKHFCQENGIIHNFTVPYNPSQNGKVERLNGILISSAKALLNEAKLSRHFWEYAVDTANFIHNRLPHQGNENKVPYEILYKKSVNYNIFRVFGCRVYFYVPKELRSKFDNNAHPGVFIGYCNNTNAYKIFDLIYNKIVTARTVEFMENEPGNLLLYHFPTNNEFRESSHIKFLKQYPHSNQSIYLDNKSDINIKSKENKMNNNIANNNQIFHIPDNTRNNNMNNNISNNINNKPKIMPKIIPTIIPTIISITLSTTTTVTYTLILTTKIITIIKEN